MTVEQEKQQAEDEFRRKMTLERQFLPTVKRLLNQTSRELATSYAASGSFPAEGEFVLEWQAALLSHYKRVGRAFLRNIRSSKHIAGLIIKQEDIEAGDVADETDAAIAAAYLLWARRRAQEQSRFIINTSINQMDQAITSTRMNTLTANPNALPTNSELAAGALKDVNAQNKARIEAIANVETQTPAEQSKAIEVAALTGAAVLPMQVIDTTRVPVAALKTWRTVGDERVRLSHVEADGQTVPKAGVFIVQGQALRFPGDTSLGATIDNVANCRCAAVYKRA